MLTVFYSKTLRVYHFIRLIILSLVCKCLDYKHFLSCYMLILTLNFGGYLEFIIVLEYHDKFQNFFKAKV